MKKSNFEFIVGIAYIVFWVGIGSESVGNVSTSCGEPYPWYMPLLVGAVVGVPFIFGYLGGKREWQDNEEDL